MRALDVITDAYERLNRLSPGETLNADDAAFGFRRLNLLVDEIGAETALLFQSILTSAAQTGAITLGAGSWAAVAPGSEIVSVTVDGWPIAPLTMQQYNELYDPTTTGSPMLYAPDGLSTVYLYPVPNGQTIQLQTRKGVRAFADQTTAYTVPPGVESYLGAALAVRLAPAILGRLPPELVRAERASKVVRLDPAIIDVGSYNSNRGAGNILNGGL